MYFALLVEVLRTLLARLCALVEALRTLRKAFYLKEMELLSRPFGKGAFPLNEMKQCTFSLKEMNIPVLEVLCHFLRLVPCISSRYVGKRGPGSCRGHRIPQGTRKP